MCCSNNRYMIVEKRCRVVEEYKLLVLSYHEYGIGYTLLVARCLARMKTVRTRTSINFKIRNKRSDCTYLSFQILLLIFSIKG